jgi:DNA-binding protein YbaB
MCKARKCTRDHWHEYDVACRYTNCDGPHSLEDLKEMNKILKSEVALATPRTDKRKVVQKALAKKDKMVTIPNMFLEIKGDVNLVDASITPNIVTRLDDKFVLDAVLKAVQDALAQSLKKGKK